MRGLPACSLQKVTQAFEPRRRVALSPARLPKSNFRAKVVEIVGRQT